MTPNRIMLGGTTSHHITAKVMDVYPLRFIEDTLSLVEKEQKQKQCPQQRGQSQVEVEQGEGGADCGKPVGEDREEDARWYKWWSARQRVKWEQQCYNDKNKIEARQSIKKTFKATFCDDEDGDGSGEFSGSGFQ